MRVIITTLLTLVTLAANAQKIEKFYDYQWKPCEPGEARFYGVMVKTDSGWHRSDYFIHRSELQMDGLYEDSACKIENGMFYYFYPGKKLHIKGRYIHGKRTGICLTFNNNGAVTDSAYFENDHPLGVRMGWYTNGFPQDSSYWLADGGGTEISWFDNGQPSSAGRYVNWNKRNGRWQFFHKNGKISAIELYDTGTLIAKQYFDEGGNYMDTVYHDRPAQFKGGVDDWVKYLSKQIYFPNYKITNADKAVTVITFTVDEDGKVQDAFVSTPFFPEFDLIALNAIKHSPAWQPAISHNRRVKYTATQSVTFSQPAEQ